MKRKAPRKQQRPRQRLRKCKKPYETPKLTKFGSVAELTQGGGGGGMDLLVMSVTG